MPHINEKGYSIIKEVNAVKDVIIGKEAKDQDASFERSLLKSWAKYPGWEYAGTALAELTPL